MKLKGNTIEFLSTPSARRATIFIRSGMALLLFLSTPSARRATGASVAFDQYEGENGTHAEFIEGLCASDMKKTSDDLAIFLKDCV